MKYGSTWTQVYIHTLCSPTFIKMDNKIAVGFSMCIQATKIIIQLWTNAQQVVEILPQSTTQSNIFKCLSE